VYSSEPSCSLTRTTDLSASDRVGSSYASSLTSALHLFFFSRVGDNSKEISRRLEILPYQTGLLPSWQIHVSHPQMSGTGSQPPPPLARNT